VTFAYPGEDEMSLAVELDGVVIGATHGHVVGKQDQFGQWLAGQALGKQPVGQYDLLFAGHHHTFRMQDLGGGRTLVACPAMDGGSAWFTSRKGVSAHVGMVSVEITPEAPYWRAPVLHSLTQASPRSAKSTIRPSSVSVRAVLPGEVSLQVGDHGEGWEVWPVSACDGGDRLAGVAELQPAVVLVARCGHGAELANHQDLQVSPGQRSLGRSATSAGEVIGRM